MKNKKLWITGLMLGFMALAPVANNQVVDRMAGVETAYAASTAQSDRWQNTGGDIWKLKTSDGAGYVSNSWFQDLDGSWYMIGSDGAMLSGLITDQSTGKSYLMNISHDGYFGKMLTTDGVYNLNGQQVYLNFDQNHVGSFGAILSGLDNARSAGVAEKSLTSITTDSASAGGTQEPVAPQEKSDEASPGNPGISWVSPDAKGGTTTGTVPNAVWG